MGDLPSGPGSAGLLFEKPSGTEDRGEDGELFTCRFHSVGVLRRGVLLSVDFGYSSISPKERLVGSFCRLSKGCGSHVLYGHMPWCDARR